MRSWFFPFAFAALLALVIGIGGCASGGAGGGTGNPNSLGAEQLADVQQLDLQQAIQRLRPRWLRGRAGATPSVVVDGTMRPEGVSALQAIRVSEVQELAFLSSSDATMRYGTGNTGGAIIVTTKR